MLEPPNCQDTGIANSQIYPQQLQTRYAAPFSIVTLTLCLSHFHLSFGEQAVENQFNLDNLMYTPSPFKLIALVRALLDNTAGIICSII